MLQVSFAQNRQLFKGLDIMVFPEGMVSLMKQTWDFKGMRVVIALNWANVYSVLPVQEKWQDYRHVSSIDRNVLFLVFIIFRSYQHISPNRIQVDISRQLFLAYSS